MPKIYITAIIPKIAIELLQSKGFQADVNTQATNPSHDDLIKIFTNYEGVITLVTDKIDADIINIASPQFRVISNYGVGFDNIDLESATKRNIAVTNTPGVASESVAEHTFGLMLACKKHIPQADNYVKQNKYKRWDPMTFLSSQLWGSTIGIVGLGRIGLFVGQIAHGGFRMKILYYDLQRSWDFELLTEAKFASLEKILTESDIVTLHVPLTPKTHHLISSDQLNLMKKSSILINTSRGSVIDESALITALKDNQIAACGLDVFENEPNINPELFNLPNIVLTPHIASATVETREEMSKIAAQNIIDIFENRKPQGQVG